MSLYDCIREMFYNDSREWNYYSCNMTFPFEATEARIFIKEYFEQGAKRGVIFPVIDEINSMRSMHTVSAFFIGLLLKKSIGENLDIICSNSDDYEFSYLWFLVCLYHDMGYAIENDWTYKFTYRNQSKKYSNIRKCCWYRSSMYEDLGLVFVAPSLYNEVSFPKWSKDIDRRNDGITFRNGIRVKRATYTRKTIFNYLEYCKMNPQIKHYDHGIVGGFWLYDSLMKNYYETYRREKEFDRDIDFENFQANGNRHFSLEQRWIFAYLADCIISHNIWPATKEKNEIYKEYDLNELVEPNFKKITFGNNPILFILAIADTIEPIKLYSGVSGMETIDIWRGIDMKFERGGMTIKLLDDRLKFSKAQTKIKDLENWGDVHTISGKDNRKIEITYNRLA